ncbi:MAG: Cd(II)/Pb(II)-responsive transcriptional regulator [Variovorax sp.]|nr:Cd(II)/Pb(II)-responsive transcriptional regulator [Variovorax sp.]
MKIGELAAVSATSIETIRYYERENLLPAPARTQGNFRVYEAPHLERLQFIRYCRSLDMSLDEVRVLLRVKDAPAQDCANVDALIDAHIEHVSTRIEELRSLEKELKALRQQCCGPRNGDPCGILTGLAIAAQEPGAGARAHSHIR